MSENQLAREGDQVYAHRLVGKFLQAFAILEQALDTGIGKLLGIEGPRNDIVCSSVPFAKKLGVFFSAEGLLAALPTAERTRELRETRGAILDLNQRRVMFAHNPFLAHEDGVAFKRVVADKELSVSVVTLSAAEVDALCVKAMDLSDRLVQLVDEMEPYAPTFDFSDPRNSGLIAAFL